MRNWPVLFAFYLALVAFLFIVRLQLETKTILIKQHQDIQESQALEIKKSVKKSIDEIFYSPNR